MFIYMDKRIPMPHRTNLHALSWNTEQGWIACGGESGLLKVLKLDSSKKKEGKANSNPITMNQTLEGHEGSVMLAVWNENYNKLTTADTEGTITVWMKFKGMWFEEMINNRNKSVVRDMAWTVEGDQICIVYEDGQVIVGSVGGERMWGKELDIELGHVQWSPDLRHLLFGTLDGEVLLYDGKVGEFASRCNVYAVDQHSGVDIAGLQWYSGQNGYLEPDVPCLAVAFVNGRMQIGRDEHDDNPIIIDTSMTIKMIRWNTYGSVLAVGGTRVKTDPNNGDQTSAEMVQFYDPFGKHLRTLAVKGKNITGLAWEGGSLRLAVAVDSTVFFANIRPAYEWGYFANTLVYSYSRPDKTENCVAFWDTKKDEKLIKYLHHLLAIRASGDNCVFATRADDDSGQYVLILCNAIGSPVDSKYIDVEPTFLAMTPFHVVVCSDTQVYVWQYKTAASKLTTLKKRALGKKKAIDRVRLFHIDDVTANKNGKSDGMMDQETNDPICAVTASISTLIVARSSGTMFSYSLPHLALEQQYIIRNRPQKLALNCTSTMLSIIDMNGYMLLFDLKSKNPEDELNSVGHQIKGFQRKDAWDMKWSADNPTLFAAMEKTRMYVYRNGEPEEPKNSTGYLCEFKDLCIRSAQLSEIMLDPEHVEKETIVDFETKSLRDTRDLLATVPISEAYEFINDHPHMRLWRILAEAALEELKFTVADKAFVKCGDYQGIQFVKRLKLLNDRYKQRAEVAAYFKRFEEAEQIFTNMGCPELAIELRMRLGDWNRVVHLIQKTGGSGNDKQLTDAFNNIGDYYADRQKWSKAFRAYSKAKNTEKMVDIAYIQDDYDSLHSLVEQIPDGSEFLKTVGAKFMSVGLCSEAVTCYLKASDAKAAIDCCILLNQWDQAVTLAEEHKFPMIQALLARYAKVLLDKKDYFQAIELYRKANRSPDAVRLILKLAYESIETHKLDPGRTKKLFILAAIENDRFKNRTLSLDQANVQNTQATLASLLEHDTATMSHKGMTESWHGAEAFHFWQLAQKQLFDGLVSSALNTAVRLQEYEDMLPEKEIYSLIALTAYYNEYYAVCSNAFIRLESMESFTEEDRKKYKKLAIQVFSRHQPPQDPPSLQPLLCSNVKCETPVKVHQTNCHECGKKFPACVISGRSILSMADTSRCSGCNHFMLDMERGNLVHCPLCHTALRF